LDELKAEEQKLADLKKSTTMVSLNVVVMSVITQNIRNAPE
jgi:hypothetical protein